MTKVRITIDVHVHDADAFTREYGEPWTFPDIAEGIKHDLHDALCTAPYSDAFRPDNEPDNHAVTVVAVVDYGVMVELASIREESRLTKKITAINEATPAALAGMVGCKAPAGPASPGVYFLAGVRDSALRAWRFDGPKADVDDYIGIHVPGWPDEIRDLLTDLGAPDTDDIDTDTAECTKIAAKLVDKILTVLYEAREQDRGH
jgi:hypothetical protein